MVTKSKRPNWYLAHVKDTYGLHASRFNSAWESDHTFGQIYFFFYFSGGWLDMHELQAIASYPYKKNMIHVTSFARLQDVVELLRDAICDSKSTKNTTSIF